MIKLRPYQQEAIGNVLRDWNEGYTDVLGTAATGSGKAQPLDAKVLTPIGWRRIGDLQVGDRVIGSDGKPHRVLGAFPQGRKDVYRVTFSDGAATECCADHLWAVQTKSHKCRDQGFVVKPLRDLMGDLVDGSGANKWFVPLVAPVELEERAVPIDPYALGALLGDGHLQQTLEDNGSVHGASVRFATVDTWLRDEVEHRLGDMGYLKHVSGCDYHVTDGKRNGRAGMTLLNHLRDLGLMGLVSHEKFVPDPYKYNSIAVRLAVLRGLMDTDGSGGPTNKAPVYCSTSRRMANDVCEIVRSLGGATRVRRRKVRGGRDAYRVTISLPMNPFRLPRKAALWNPNPKQGRTRAIVGMERVGSAECQCILVDAPDHLYVTDDYVVTHNTIVFLALMKAVLDEQPNKRWLILAHRKELIEQPIERLQQFFPMLALKAGIVMAHHDECERQIVVATVQTLSSEKRLTRVLVHGAFDYLIVDEAHHSAAASYITLFERLREANPALKHLGVTATPIRADGQGLRTVYQTESFHYGIREMVKMRYLVPPRWLAIQTGISLKGVASRGGDFVGKQLADVYETQNCFDLVVESHRKYADGRQCIAFVESVDGAYRLAETFREAGIVAEAADGTTRKGDRADILKRFRKGETQVLCNVGLYTEGLDVPQVSCIHQVRPTKSDGLYLQMVGRSLRPVPGKEDALILDYAPVEARNVCMLGDVLGVEIRKDAYIEDAEEPGEVIAGMTFDGEEKWLEGNPAEIISRQLDYLELSPFSWNRADGDGWMSLGLGEGGDKIERTLVVSPPDGEGFVCLYTVAKDKAVRSTTVEITEHGDFEHVAEVADTLIDRHANAVLAKRNVQWRKQPATDAQFRFAKSLGVWQDGMSKGECAQAITHKLAMRAIQREERRGIKRNIQPAMQSAWSAA